MPLKCCHLDGAQVIRCLNSGPTKATIVLSLTEIEHPEQERPNEMFTVRFNLNADELKQLKEIL